MLYIDLQYFPCVNYIATLCKSNEVNFGLEFPFRKSSFRNRMIIAGSSGPISLSIPIIGSRSNRLPYDQIEIDYRSSWQRDHFRTLITAYGNSPFFLHYRDELESLFTQRKELLHEWNLFCLRWMLNKLKLLDQFLIVETSKFVGQQNSLYTDIFTPSNYDKHDSLLKYPQVFDDRVGFLPNLSTLDMLFNVGPEAGNLLKQFKL